jgi:hypothetical protein
MPTKKLNRSDKLFCERLGSRVRAIILTEKKYPSLDAFSLEHHDLIAKPTLYQLCDGKRDMKVSTLRGLAKALGMSLESLIAGL